MKIIRNIFAGSSLLFFVYGLLGLLTNRDPLTDVKYDEMAGMFPMILLLFSFFLLLVFLLLYYIQKRKRK
ncbi:MAG: hypothetical protein OEZ13_11725 [Spirochaetia bacterium]|nr:hypothetical protein [Spirochaetia bacterium]